MKLFEILCENCFDLFEGRIETLKSLYKQRIDAKLRHDNRDDGWMTIDANAFIDTVASYDPTTKKIYVQWLLNSFLKGEVKAEDLYKSRDHLTLFDKFKNKLQIKDINKYTPKSLFHAVKDIDPESASSKKQEKQQIKTEGADVIIKGPDCTILRLKTEEAACYYGRQTEWCTAATTAENMFNHYNDTGQLYVAICDDGRKFQLHIVETQLVDEETPPIQFMDENDESVDVSDVRSQYPTIDKFFKTVVEPYILKDAWSAYDYAKDVIQGRWPEAEPIIMKRADCACYYAIDVIQDRWPEAEPIILKDERYSYEYKENLGIE